MEPIGRILELVQKALDDFDDSAVPLSAIAQRALRIARLRHDYTAVWWLTREVAGSTDEAARARLRAELTPHFTDEEWSRTNSWVVETFVAERAAKNILPTGEIEAEEKVMPGSVAEIEDGIERLAAVAQGSQPLAKDQGFQVQDWAMLSAGQHRAVLGRLRHRIHEYLSQTEEQLIYGQILSDAFERNRRYVDEGLQTRAPETFEQLTAAYQRLREGTDEGRVHAVTSCRRALKSVADVLYAPSDGPVIGPDGIEHAVTDDKFINRLWQFASERGKDRSVEMLLVQVTDLGNRVEALNDLASKGVHAAIADYEADQCMIQTYLTIGDLLRLDDRTSAAAAEATAGGDL